MDLDRFLEDHAAAFVRAYTAETAKPAPGRRAPSRTVVPATKTKAGTRAATGPTRRGGTRSRR
jgi:hypothetical protein